MSGLNVVALFREFLVREGFTSFKGCESIAEEFQERVEGVDWLETGTGMTFDKAFVPKEDYPDTKLVSLKTDPLRVHIITNIVGQKQHFNISVVGGEKRFSYGTRWKKEVKDPFVTRALEVRLNYLLSSVRRELR